MARGEGGGRPSKYSPAVVAAICERLGKGEPLAQIGRDEGMPAYRTVKDWMDERPDVAAAISRAREEGFDAIANSCMDIADSTDDKPDCRKVRIWTRLQLLAKWDPKRYGERLQTDANINITKSAADLTDEELAAIAASKPPKE